MNKTIISLLLLLTLIFVAGSFTSLAQTRRALIIGISDYGNPDDDYGKWTNLHGANDVDLLTPLLIEQGFKVTSLKDSLATYEGIVNSLKKLIMDTNKGDFVYLHFSMHGQPFEDLNGDEEDGWDEALIPVDAEMSYKPGVYEGENHLLDDELSTYSDSIRQKLGPEGKLYVILDACHSGTASKGSGEHVRGTKGPFTRSGKRFVPDKTNNSNDYFHVEIKEDQSPVTFIEACRSYQANNEVLDRKTDIMYGSLSYYIANALKDNKIYENEDWIESVKQGMVIDPRLSEQNIVIEKSE